MKSTIKGSLFRLSNNYSVPAKFTLKDAINILASLINFIIKFNFLPSFKKIIRYVFIHLFNNFVKDYCPHFLRNNLMIKLKI